MTDITYEGAIEIETSILYPHPQNPRISVRDDVVSAIAANLKEGFDPAHALIVRRLADGYQIISGHHRKAAAEKVGIGSVPCWVRDVDDDAAYMALVTSNSQGELSPLEIGLHALHCVGLSEGGRGKKGGLSAYAERVGKAQNTISELVNAARVVVKVSVDRYVLHNKTQHLAAIHALPESVWPAAVDAMVVTGWGAKETAERVKVAKTGETAKRIEALLMNNTSKRELNRIDALRKQVAESLLHNDLISQWESWCNEEDPIDIKLMQEMRITLENEQYERDSQDIGVIEKPNLVLADPPWRYDFAETDNRQIENQYPTGSVDEIIFQRPDTHPDCVLFLWATMPKLKEAIEVMEGWGFKYKTGAAWDKQKIGMGYWFRGQHELLLVGTKGDVSPPAKENRISSVFREPRTEHSKKPESVYEWIELAFPGYVKLEMYCREPRIDWLVSGNEAGESIAAA